MGPSGAGKSTLLDILAGKDKRGMVAGVLTHDGVLVTPNDVTRVVAYVDQDDLLLPSLTVRETLYFSAKLRLPESMTSKEKMTRVDEVLDTLGLSHVANSRVGGFGMRGISGGERRRVSIGVELVTSPGILFLDEPTSGLDSFNAHAVIEALHTLAHVHQKTIIFTVHQPRSDMFSMFDQVIVLAAGSILYAGRGAEAAAKLKQEGTPCPDGYNMADHLLDLAVHSNRGSDGDHVRDRSNVPVFTINIGGRKGLRQRPSKGAGSRDVGKSVNTTAPLLANNGPHMSHEAKVGFLTQLSELVNRSTKHLVRTPSLFLSHVLLSILLGVFVGGVYYKSDVTISGIQNRLGSLFFVLSLIGFSSLSAIGAFAPERNLFIRERSNGVYGSMAFYLSKIICDIIPLRVLPAFFTGTITFFMVGYQSTGDHYPKFLVLLLLFSAIMGLTCLSLAIAISDVGTATLVGAILILFKMLFAGLIISQDSIPQAIHWIQYLSFFRYPYEGMAVNDMGLIQISDTFDGAAVNVTACLVDPDQIRF
ncbi:P-loop containing nucleoside triphosphate hydrolase protein [Chytriomyces sp. MP71]|nr:P-loop containing nucleoside triphosphate hydrolase protein [Chytriomyces sp. MP71]